MSQFKNAKELSLIVDEYVFVIYQDEKTTNTVIGYKPEYEKCILGCFVAGEQIE